MKTTLHILWKCQNNSFFLLTTRLFVCVENVDVLIFNFGFFLFFLFFFHIQPLPIEECFKECDVFMLKEALEYSFGYVDKHPEFVPSGMSRDCAVAVVLYTFGEYLAENILSIS